jgi:hypothetical protein
MNCATVRRAHRIMAAPFPARPSRRPLHDWPPVGA